MRRELRREDKTRVMEGDLWLGDEETEDHREGTGDHLSCENYHAAMQSLNANASNVFALGA